MQKLNEKLQQMFDRLSKLSFKQLFIICIPVGIAFFIFQTYKDFSSHTNNEILSKQEIEYLHKWYQKDYERDLAKGNQVFSLSTEETLKLDNQDPTIPLIYKIPKYIIQNPNDEWTAYIFSAYLKVHILYCLYQFDINEQAQYAKIKPEELMLFEDTFYAYKTLMQADSIQALNFASAFFYVGSYMEFADTNNDYCEVWGDMRAKLDIAIKDVEAMLQSQTYQDFFGQEAIEEIKEKFSISNKRVEKLKACK